MIVRSVLVAAVAFLLWSITIGFLPEDLGWEQPIWNENLSLGQDFLYTDSPGANDIVVLGSSLSALLPLDTLAGRRVYRLSLSGMGVQDGLRILESLPEAPALVLVETNLIVKPPNEDFGNALLSPASRELKRYLPAMRQRNQPVTVLMGSLFYLKNGPPAERLPVVLPERPINEFMLDRRREEYAVVIPAEKLEENLRSLHGRLDRLAASGDSRIALFEMPVHPDLCLSPRAEGLREGLREVFSGSSALLLLEPDCGTYRTTDGHHLNPSSAAAYSRRLAAWVETIFTE